MLRFYNTPTLLWFFSQRAVRQKFYAFVLSVPSLFGSRVKLGFPLEVNWKNRDTFCRGKNISSESLLGNMLSWHCNYPVLKLILMEIAPLRFGLQRGAFLGLKSKPVPYFFPDIDGLCR